MARFQIFASSSKGNSSFLSCGGTSILIDAGISCKRICRAIEEAGGDARELSAILITHEHSDHISGLSQLLKKADIPVWAPAAVLRSITSQCDIPRGASLTEIGGKAFAIGDIGVRPFATPHDSSASVGFRFELPNGETVGIATDLGHVTDEVRAGLLGCKTVLLEANYDEALLRMGSYPVFLKERIRSAFGHLENSESARFAAELTESGTTRIFLGHLSRENNSPPLAMQTALAVIGQSGAVRGVDYELETADYDLPTRAVRF